MAVFTEVKEVLKSHKKKNRLQSTLVEIERSGFGIVKLDKQNYKNVQSQACCYRTAIKRAGLNWGVFVENGIAYVYTGANNNGE